MQESVNNYLTGLYPLQNGGYQPSPYTTIHLSLLGDPTLRMFYLPRPANFSVKDNNGNKCFSWDEVPDVIGYNIYSINTDNVPTKLNSSLITGTNFEIFSNASKFMVRSVNFNENNGKYLNMSLGTITENVVSGNCDSPSLNTLILKGALGGAISGSVMRNSLEALLLLPTVSPYSPSTGMTLTTNNVVDWVELKILNTDFCVVDSISAVMKRNCSIVLPNGQNITLAISPGNYYLKLVHRNHISITSAQPIYFNGGDITFDFRTQPLYGGSDAGIETVLGRAMIEGDVNGDGKISYTGTNNDRDALLNMIGNPITTPVFGYSNGDLNLDGITSYSGTSNDRDLILKVIGGSNPSNVITEKKGTCH